MIVLNQDTFQKLFTDPLWQHETGYNICICPMLPIFIDDFIGSGETALSSIVYLEFLRFGLIEVPEGVKEVLYEQKKSE